MEAPARIAGNTANWGRSAATLALLWLAGAALRVTVLAVPPIIPAIHRDLGLDETGIGILSSLPTLMFAWAAIPGSLLISRFGALRTLTAGLLITALAGALRGAADTAFVLYATTLAMGLGISVMQPTLPPLVRQWMPNRIGFGTSVYSNGWLVGEILAVWLTIPYVLPAFHDSWRLSLVFWAVPVLVAAMLVVAFAPRRSKADTIPSGGRRWWPAWRQGLLWRMSLTMGGANIVYWSSNAFIPDFLTHAGRPEMIGGALTALNIGQLPVSLLLLGVAGRLAGRTWPLLIMGSLTLAGVLGIVFTDGIWIEISAGLVGFACAGTMILILTIPPLICAIEDVPRMTAGLFFISYNCSVVASIVGGALWDTTQSPYPAFGLIALGALAIVILPNFAGGLRNRTAGTS